MNNADVVILLIGAGIGLTSSLLTTIVTSTLNYWLSSRAKRTDKIERAHHLMGRMVVLTNDKPDKWVDAWAKQKKVLDNFIKLGNERDLEGIIGLIEEGIEKLEYMRAKAESKDKELAEKEKELAEQEEKLTELQNVEELLRKQLRDILSGHE